MPGSGSKKAALAIGNHLDAMTVAGTANATPTIAAAVGAIARIKRPMRFSFYHASDNHWYLGIRSWNSATLQFNTIQPVSGPFASVSQGRGTRFQYFDDAGNRLWRQS